MTEDEAWTFLREGHTGIMTTLRIDGRPVALPVWFVVVDHTIVVQTRGKKVARVRGDERASFLVEAGLRWQELRAVHLDCRAHVVEPDVELAERVSVLMDEKYGDYRMAGDDMPRAARDHYRKTTGAMIVLVPDGKLLTWDNRKLVTA